MDTPEVHAHHHHATGHRWLDALLAVSAIMISLISLVVAIEHGRVMQKLVEANQKQVEASTWPYLQIDTSVSVAGGAPSITTTVSNHGNGPARIKTGEVLLDGKPMANLPDLVRHCCMSGVRQAHFDSALSQIDGSVLAPRESSTLVQLTPRDADAAEIARAIVKAGPRIAVRACYCSVFDQCWIAGQNQAPREVRLCPTNTVNFGH